jgi:hypothetical protein
MIFSENRHPLFADHAPATPDFGILRDKYASTTRPESFLRNLKSQQVAPSVIVWLRKNSRLPVKPATIEGRFGRIRHRRFQQTIRQRFSLDFQPYVAIPNTRTRCTVFSLACVRGWRMVAS